MMSRNSRKRAQVDLAVLPATGDVAGRVVENGLEESQGAGIDVMNVTMNSTPKNPGVPLVVGHLASSVARFGTRRDVAILNHLEREPRPLAEPGASQCRVASYPVTSVQSQRSGR